MIRIEKVIQDEQPDWVIVYGDTNSTIAGALSAAKLHVPVVHIEAGLRSFDREMPEEINRILTDHLSSLLFAPTQVAIDNLRREGITEGVHNVGDVRMDVVLNSAERARPRQAALLDSLGIDGRFALSTIHRASNTDDRARLSAIVEAFDHAPVPMVLPIHPRLGKMLGQFGLQFGPNVRCTEPLGYLDLIALLDACDIVITDSGGLQKEAYMLERPTVTMRDTTEWIETVDAGWNRLCEPETGGFKTAVTAALSPPPAEHPDFYGTFGVSERIVDVLFHHYDELA